LTLFYPEQDEVRIAIKDWDRLGKYTDMGEIVVALSQLAQLKEESWIGLSPTIYMSEKNKHIPLGEILVKLELKIPPSVAPRPRRGSITVGLF
jgi:hypothetical protein